MTCVHYEKYISTSSFRAVPTVFYRMQGNNFYYSPLFLNRLQ